MPENNSVTNNRQRYSDRLKTKYPDKSFEDDESLFGQINDDYDSYDKQIGEYQSREKTLTDLFASNPKSAAVFTDWRNGVDPIVSIMQRYGDDFKAALDDPTKMEQIAAANKEYASNIAKEKEYEAQYEQNIASTLENIEKVQTEMNADDDTIDKAMDLLVGNMKNGLLGLFDEETIRMAINALNHDADVAMADREGEVRGRNSKIEEKLRKSTRGDGTPSLSGKNGGGNGTAREMPDLGAIDKGFGSQNIWERGGEKRKAFK